MSIAQNLQLEQAPLSVQQTGITSLPLSDLSWP